MNRALMLAIFSCSFTSALAAQTGSESTTVVTGNANMGTLPTQPLVMVHGLRSSPETWQTLRSLMVNDHWAIYAPQLNPTGSFLSNKLALADSFYAKGLSANSVIVGHSMGGINSRELSRSQSLAGLVTMGTPHLGAPAARNLRLDWASPFVQTQVELIDLAQHLDAFPRDAWEWVGDWVGYWDIVDARDRGQGALLNLQFLTFPGIAFGLDQTLGSVLGGDALRDLADDSQAIATLAGAEYQEQAIVKRAFFSIMQEGYYGHEFTFLPEVSETRADELGQLMVNDGVQTFFAGWNLQMLADLEHRYDISDAAAAVMTVGDAEAFFWNWWAYDVIEGGMLSDGVVPYASQIGWGNNQHVSIGAAFHTHETAALAAEVRTQVNALFNHSP